MLTFAAELNEEMMIKRHFLPFVMVLLFGWGSLRAASATADFVPVVSNYSQSAYGGGLQNWSVTQSADGKVYFGNQRGLLSFDGYQWNCSKLPNRAIVRSVLADGDRIYVGSYTDFGFFRRNSRGGYDYTSLWPSHYRAHNDEIWKIVKAPNGHIYFQSFCSWFDYDGRHVVAHYDERMLPLHFFVVGKEVYVQMVNGGLCLLRNSRYLPIVAREAYGNDDIVGMLPGQGGALLCVTSRNGIYILRNGAMTRWNTELDGALRSFQVNHTAQLGRSTLVVGTILNGIYALDLNSGRQLWHYNMANSLNNNTVLGLLTDQGHNVWAALDNGISLVHTGSPVTVMRTDRLGLPIGMVYGITRRGSDMYVATNQSLWHYSLTSHKLTQVEGSNGQNWYVADMDGEVMAGHNLSTLSVAGATAHSMAGSTEGATCIRHYRADGHDVLIEAGYSSLRVYRRVDGRWRFSHTVRGFMAPLLELEIDNSGSLWGAHFSKGVYRINLSQNLTRVEQMEYFGAPTPKGIHSQMHVMKIRGRVVLSYQGKLYTYDDMHGRIVPYEGDGARLPQGMVAAVAVDNASFWTADMTAFSYFRTDGNQLRRMAYIPHKVFGLEVNTNGLAQYVYGDDIYFFLNNGIGRYRMGHRGQMAPRYPLTVDRVTSVTSDNKTEAIACDDNGENTITSDNIGIMLSYPNYDDQLLTYRYRLKGRGTDIRSEQTTPALTFNSLGYGSYTLEAEVVSIDGEVLGKTSYAFERAVPFYLSWWALMVYGMAIFLLIRQYVNWRTEKIVRRNKRMAEEELMRQNLKMLEQKQIIAAQQQIIMENELTSKSKELATMAFQMAVQRSHSEVMREELLEKKRAGLLTDKDFRDLITKAEGSDTDEVWSVFQQNFDLIHQNFFRNLRSRYPELTATDLKFCALLRLNLNTKEIAKLTNLTIRGVEGARYRLRKKLGIRIDQSLTEFLIDLR